MSVQVQRLARIAFVSVLLSSCYSADPVAPSGVRQDATPLPPPALDDPLSENSRFQTAVLAGGCFWSVEAVFEHVRGVVDVVSGYSGGTAETATYELVAIAQTTDHAQVVEITFDSSQITYGQLLHVFFAAAHDPTEVGGQYPDVGLHYRSNIFYTSEEQRLVAEAYIAQLDESGLLPAPIATRVDPLEAFYWAEEEHQDFVSKNPDHPYVQIFSFAKLIQLGALFHHLFTGEHS